PEPQSLFFHVFEEIERIAVADKEYRLGIIRFATGGMYLNFQTYDDIALLTRNVLHRGLLVYPFHYNISVAVPEGIANIGLVHGGLFEVFKSGLRGITLGLHMRIGHCSGNQRINIVDRKSTRLNSSHVKISY